jgi:hypothetical protein
MMKHVYLTMTLIAIGPYTSACIIWSSMMKHVYPSMTYIVIGRNTSTCIRHNNLLDLSLFQ